MSVPYVGDLVNGDGSVYVSPAPDAMTEGISSAASTGLSISDEASKDFVQPGERSEPSVQILKDDESVYENESYVEIGRKLVSAKNSLELISMVQGNHRRNLGLDATSVDGRSLSLILQNINEGEEADTDLSKSVILNATNANIKANGHHVNWVEPVEDENRSRDGDNEVENQPLTETQFEVSPELQTNGMTLSNDVLGNPFLNCNNQIQNQHQYISGSDDDFLSNEKTDVSKLLSVEGLPIPDPMYVAQEYGPAYYPLIKRRFKKDCRVWLYKNTNLRERTRSIFNDMDPQAKAKVKR